jgi:hypothetical protein
MASSCPNEGGSPADPSPNTIVTLTLESRHSEADAGCRDQGERKRKRVVWQACGQSTRARR